MQGLLGSDGGSVVEDATVWRHTNSWNSYYVKIWFADNITVDWGDGNIQQYNNWGSHQESQLYHQYSGYPENQEYFQVKVTGVHTKVQFYNTGSESSLIQLISGAKTLSDFCQMCRDCSNLKNIADSFFIYDNAEYETDCSRMFQWSGIQTINHNIFKYKTLGCNCSSMFSSCNNLVRVLELSIPDKSNTMYMFGWCQNLQLVDGQTLVKRWNSGHTGNHYGMFDSCYNMTGSFIEYYWWDQYDGGPVSWRDFYNNNAIFYNCTSLVNYDEIPYEWKNY